MPSFLPSRTSWARQLLNTGLSLIRASSRHKPQHGLMARRPDRPGPAGAPGPGPVPHHHRYGASNCIHRKTVDYAILQLRRSAQHREGDVCVSALAYGEKGVPSAIDHPRRRPPEGRTCHGGKCREVATIHSFTAGLQAASQSATTSSNSPNALEPCAAPTLSRPASRGKKFRELFCDLVRKQSILPPLSLNVRHRLRYFICAKVTVESNF